MGITVMVLTSKGLETITSYRFHLKGIEDVLDHFLTFFGRKTVLVDIVFRQEVQILKGNIRRKSTC